MSLCALLCACPSPGANDGGTPESDGGAGNEDAGTDAGQPRDAGTPDAGQGPVDPADWCAKKALAECQRSARCLRLSAANLAACVAEAQLACDATAYARGVAEGRLAYDPDAGARCLDAYASGSCERLPLTCEGLFKGLVPPDGGCLLAEECNADGFCFMYDGVCPHRCRAYAGKLEACNNFDKLCRPPGGCEQIDAGVLGCVDKKDAGEGCTSYSGCGLNMACNQGACIEVRVGLGASCNVSNGYPFCDTEYFCRQPPPPSGGGTRPPGTCELKSGVGGVCNGYDSCLPSLNCSGLITTGTCTGKAALGDTCRQYGDCQDQLFCEPGTTRCAALPADGGDCSSNGSFFDCAVGFWCDFSSPVGDYRCRPKQPLEGPCSYDSSCLSNHCEYGPLTDGGVGQRCVVSCSQKADGGL
jgi:hypothetical protein